MLLCWYRGRRVWVSYPPPSGSRLPGLRLTARRASSIRRQLPSVGASEERANLRRVIIRRGRGAPAVGGARRSDRRVERTGVRPQTAGQWLRRPVPSAPSSCICQFRTVPVNPCSRALRRGTDGWGDTVAGRRRPLRSVTSLLSARGRSSGTGRGCNYILSAYRVQGQGSARDPPRVQLWLGGSCERFVRPQCPDLDR